MNDSDRAHNAQCGAPAVPPGSALIARVTFAVDAAAARAAVLEASVQARYEACDLLYLDADGHAMPWMVSHIVSEARA